MLLRASTANLKHLSRRYAAEVDWEAFEDAYRSRAEGEDIKMSRDLQRNFAHPETDVQKRTAEYIAQYLKEKRAEWKSEVFTQKRRIAAAEESLAKKETARETSGSEPPSPKPCWNAWRTFGAPSRTTKTLASSR